MSRATLLLLGLAACGANKFDSTQVDAYVPPTSDAAGSCAVTPTFTPANPVAAPGLQVRAVATVEGGEGVIDYQWSVTLGNAMLATTYQAADHSQIDFPASMPGVYNVTVIITGPGSCPEGIAALNVAAQGANVADYRLRVVPPSNLAPPQETIIQVSGGADYDHPVLLDPGLDVVAAVTNGSVGVPAYLRFSPPSAPNAIVETFSGSDGGIETRLLGQPYTVLIVPAVPGLAPALLAWTPGTQTFTLGPGAVVTGTVKNPAGAALAGATVQLASNGVPSTLATTAADGSFSVNTAFTAGALVSVTVQPAAGSGLPRLDASAMTFDLAQPMQIRYAAGVTTCDLASTPIKRNGANQPNAQVTVVGSLAAIAGTVTAGAAANATGTVEIAASADATGKLPSMLVPRAPLSAVVSVAAGDLAVAAIDTSTCAAQTIVAQSMTLVGGTVQDPQLDGPSGIAIEATPNGALAAAGEPPVIATSNTGGGYAIPFASGGFYDVRFHDPAGRGAPLVLLDINAAGVPAAAQLPKALQISGTVSVSGNSNPIAGASVQILCATCTGIDATRPIAETATDVTGAFVIAVPDPGTM